MKKRRWIAAGAAALLLALFCPGVRAGERTIQLAIPGSDA